MYSIQEAKEEAVLQLLSWDCPINAEMVKKVLKDWISNLRTHIGKAAHEYEAQFVEDHTGMTWDEQDAQCIEQIGDYEKALEDIENGNDDWAGIEEKMLKIVRGE